MNTLPATTENPNPVLVITVKSTIETRKEIIDKAHESFLDEVKKSSENLAVIGLPEATASTIEPFIEFIRHTYSGILNDVSLELGAAVRNQLGALDIFSIRQKIKDLNLKANSAATTLETLRASRKKYVGQKSEKEFSRIKLMVNVFAVIEVLGYILSCLAIGDNFMLATIWGVMLGIGQTIGIKSLVLWMRDGSGAKLSTGVKRGIWAAVALVATGLGWFRYKTLQGTGDNDFAQSIFAPFFFILISYFLISVVAVYVWHNYPTPEDESNIKKTASLDDEIAAKDAELKEYHLQINQLNTDCNSVAQVHTLLIHAFKDFYHRINNHFLYAVGLFKNTNLIKRTDTVNPACFSQPVSPLVVPKYDEFVDGNFETNPVTEPA